MQSPKLPPSAAERRGSEDTSRSAKELRPLEPCALVCGVEMQKIGTLLIRATPLGTLLILDLATARFQGTVEQPFLFARSLNDETRIP